MSNANNFGLTGVSSNVKYGKGNGRIVFDGTNGFRIRNSGNSADATLLITDGTASNSATTKQFVETYYTGINGLTVSSGTFSIVLDTNPGLSTSVNGLKLDYTALGAAGTVQNTDTIAISQSGVIGTTTVADLVDSVLTIAPSAANGTIIADGANSSFNVGYPLPNYSGLTTYVTKVKMNITGAFSGNSVANAIVTDGVNTLMLANEDNISVVNAYMTELPFSFSSNGDQCVVNFFQADGTTPAAPTAGTAVISVEYDLVGPAGAGGAGTGVISVATGTGLTGGPITTSGTISMAASGVTAGTYGSASNVAQIVVDALGRVTSATNIALSSGGNVTGPLVATDSAVALYDGTTGTLIKNSSVTIDSSGNISSNSLKIGTSTKQTSKEVIMYNTTTNGSATELFLDGSSQRLALPNNATWLAEVRVAARRTDAANESDIFYFDGGIDRQGSAATTAMIGTASSTNIEQSTNWDLTVDADTSNGSLRLTATGEAGKTIRWTAFVRIVEALN